MLKQREIGWKGALSKAPIRASSSMRFHAAWEECAWFVVDAGRDDAGVVVVKNPTVGFFNEHLSFALRLRRASKRIRTCVAAPVT